MSTNHVLQLIVDREVGEDQGRRMLVDQIVALFPDAIVDGQANVATDGKQLVVSQKFRSPMFDRIADNITAAVIEELDFLAKAAEESMLLKGQAKKVYRQALHDAIDHIHNVWGLE